MMALLEVYMPKAFRHGRAVPRQFGVSMEEWGYTGMEYYVQLEGKLKHSKHRTRKRLMRSITP